MKMKSELKEIKYRDVPIRERQKRVRQMRKEIAAWMDEFGIDRSLYELSWDLSQPFEDGTEYGATFIAQRCSNKELRGTKITWLFTFHMYADSFYIHSPEFTRS